MIYVQQPKTAKEQGAKHYFRTWFAYRFVNNVMPYKQLVLKKYITLP